MRWTLFLMIGLLAACGREETGPEPQPRAQVQTAELTGLYESRGADDERSRLCMMDRNAGETLFGMVAWGPDGGVCSGAGTAVRDGDTIRLTMAGDEQCVIEASARGTELTFPATVSNGCSYYCSRDASFAGKVFDKTGGTAEDAMRATDLVGDPLCY
jgi:hypothetical protein